MNIKRLLFVCNLCAVVLLFGAGSVWAQDLLSAKVLSSQGPVEIRRQPSDQPTLEKVAFKVEDKLRAGDTIITGKNGRLVLGLSDGSQAVIAAQTTVVIKDLSQSPRTIFNVIRGKTRVHIEKLGGQPNPYRVNTPTAVIAVRGTIFDVLVNGDETQVFVHEGEVAVTNLILPERPVILVPGQTTKVFRQQAPANPGTFKPGRNDGSFQENKRIASNNTREGNTREGNTREGNAREGNARDGNGNDRGGNSRDGNDRGGSSANNSRQGGLSPDRGRSAGSSGDNSRPMNSPADSSRPGGESRGGGKRP